MHSGDFSGTEIKIQSSRETSFHHVENSSLENAAVTCAEPSESLKRRQALRLSVPQRGPFRLDRSSCCRTTGLGVRGHSAGRTYLVPAWRLHHCRTSLPWELRLLGPAPAPSLWLCQQVPSRRVQPDAWGSLAGHRLTSSSGLDARPCSFLRWPPAHGSVVR